VEIVREEGGGEGAYWNEERAEVIALTSSVSVSGSNPSSELTQSLDIVEGLFLLEGQLICWDFLLFYFLSILFYFIHSSFLPGCSLVGVVEGKGKDG